MCVCVQVDLHVCVFHQGLRGALASGSGGSVLTGSEIVDQLVRPWIDASRGRGTTTWMVRHRDVIVTSQIFLRESVALSVLVHCGVVSREMSSKNRHSSLGQVNGT